MNLNDQSHLYFIFDLTPLPLRFHNTKSPVRKGNERYPDADELQRHLAIATTNIGVRCGENLTAVHSGSILTSPPNNRSPPIRQECSISRIGEMQFLSKKLHNKKYD